MYFKWWGCAPLYKQFVFVNYASVKPEIIRVELCWAPLLWVVVNPTSTRLLRHFAIPCLASLDQKLSFLHSMWAQSQWHLKCFRWSECVSVIEQQGSGSSISGGWGLGWGWGALLCLGFDQGQVCDLKGSVSQRRSPLLQCVWKCHQEGQHDLKKGVGGTHLVLA